MADTEHGNSRDLHRLENWVYANAALRNAATGFVIGDIGKVAFQQSDNTYWRLIATTPTWIQIGGSGLAGGGGVLSYPFLFNTSTANADPGAGMFASDDPTWAATTVLHISGKDNNGFDNRTGIENLLVPPWPSYAVLVIQSVTDPTIYAIFNLTQYVDNTTYVDYAVFSPIIHNGTFTNGMALTANFIPIFTPTVGSDFPLSPTGTTSTTAVMMGLARQYTPEFTGQVIVWVSGTIKNTTSGDGAEVQIRVGTGAAPANGDALAGSAISGQVKFTAAASPQEAPFAIQGVGAGPSAMQPGTAYWIDVSLAAITGGTASLTDVSVTFFEAH